MRRAFTLIELLVVIGIMGLMGTASVGGYRAMRRGMEDKGVMQNVNSFLSAAFQRAQIDRQPTAVYFWNETIRGSSADEDELVVGRAVAVRRAGRLSLADGQFLYDEFADLEQTYPKADENGGSSNTDDGFYLYPMESLSAIEGGSDLLRSTVEDKVHLKELNLTYLTGTDQKTEGNFETYAFKLSSKDNGKVTWKAGMAYGFEFANIELPHGYIFGQNYSSSISQPIVSAGAIVFDVGYNDGNGLESAGSRKISVYQLRPDKSGNLSKQRVGESNDPSNTSR